MVESSIVTYEDHLIDYQIGTPVSVEFDFDKVWNFYKSYSKRYCGKNIDINNLCFYHVHPEGYPPEDSETDRNCIEGYFQAFGDWSFFYIITFYDSNINNIDFNILSMSYMPFVSQLTKEKRFCRAYHNIDDYNNNIFKIDYWKLILLKSLSYGNFKGKDR